MIRYYEGPAMKELYPNKNFIFVQDSAPFYRTNTVQCFFREELKSRFVANTEWSPLLLTVAQKCSVKKCSQMFYKIHRKIIVSESIFNKVAGIIL